MAVKRRARFLGIEAQRGIVLALVAVILRIIFLQAAHKFPMAVQSGIRELRVQLLQQQSEGFLLLWCACVLGRLAILCTPSDIDHSDAVSVLALASVPLGRAVATFGTVGTRLLDGPALVDGAIKFYHIVISDVPPVVRRRLMPTANVLRGERLAFRSCGAMDDDFICYTRISVGKQCISG